jgi:hypothetical protein
MKPYLSIAIILLLVLHIETGQVVFGNIVKFYMLGLSGIQLMSSIIAPEYMAKRGPYNVKAMSLFVYVQTALAVYCGWIVIALLYVGSYTWLTLRISIAIEHMKKKNEECKNK